MHAFLIILFLLVVSCQPAERRPVGPVYEPVDTAACHDAEANLKKLNCREATLPSGKPFNQFCFEKMVAGIPLAPRCLSKITSCDQVESVCNP